MEQAFKYKDNPAYKLEREDGIHFIYTPVNIAEGYHTSRYVAALNQEVYAASGANKEVLQELMNEIILRCNKPSENDTLRTDIAAIAQNVIYRTQYPVDHLCAVRMGTVLTFMEVIEDGKVLSEPSDKVDLLWQQKKETLALEDGNFYDFFLALGGANLKTYEPHYDILTDMDYSMNRKMILDMLQINRK
jgi:hypothetical protein